MQLADSFTHKYQNLLKDEAESFFTSLTKEEARNAFRFNPNKKDGLKVENYYKDKLTPNPYASNSYYGKVQGRSFLHSAGYVYSQEASASLVASIADVKPGEKVLDLCAAPGGKSTQLASSLRGGGLLVSNEIVPKRARILSENIERWGVKNALVVSFSPDELVNYFTGYFDKVVVDAPCSGEGMFRRDNDSISQWDEDSPIYCSNRQVDILESAVKLLKLGGKLIYSTCTFAPEENEQIIDYLLEYHPFELIKPSSILDSSTLELTSSGRPEWTKSNNKSVEDTIRLWPHHGQGEGHFVACLKYHGDNFRKTKKSKKKNKAYYTKASKTEVSVFYEFLKDTGIKLRGNVYCRDKQLWLVPEAFDEFLMEIPSLRTGVHLGEFRKNRFIPSHSLALALTEDDLEEAELLEVNYDEWLSYVKGETLTRSGSSGWRVLSYKGLPFSFGNHVQGTVKNFYPKGLRFNGLEEDDWLIVS